MNQSGLEANTCRPAKRRKTRASKSQLVLVLLLIGRESGVRFFSQSQTVAMQNQSNCVITFDTQLKTALLMWNTSKAKAVECLFANLVASNLHENSKVCEMITGARDFLIHFFD